jgi:hypothetical protein
MMTKLLPPGWAASFPITATSGRLACAILFGCLMLPAFGTVATCQDNPFGTSGAAPDEPPPALDEEEKEEVVEQDPLVRAIDNLKPTTPLELMRATQAVLNLRRADVAKRYLQQLIDSNPSPRDLAELQRKYGSALFLRLATDEALQPQGAAISKSVTDAAEQLNSNQQRLAELVQRFLSAAPEARGPFLVELKRGGAAAATPLIQVLADPGQADQHRLARGALVALGDSVTEPTVAALQSSDEALQLQIIDVLGQLEYRPAAPYLLQPALSPNGSAETQQAAKQALEQMLGGVPSPEEAIRFLKKRLDSYLAGSYPAQVDEENQVTRWIWNPEKNTPELLRMPADDASIAAAAEMANSLNAISPDSAEFKLIRLVTSLESAKRSLGFDQPLTGGDGTARDAAAAAGTEVLEQALNLSLRKKMHGAAIAILDILGEVGNATMLEDPAGQPRAVSLALLDGNRRVRYSAAEAIVGWDPKRAYPGSSRLPEVLGFFASTGGRPRVLIGHPRLGVAQTIAGHFSQLGFEADPVMTGRQALLMALESPDYAFAVFSDALDRPAFSDIIQQLRKDPRTAALPIGIAAREANRQRAEWLAARDDLTLALALPLELEAAAFDTRRLLAAAGRSLMSQSERMRQARFALDALAKYAEQEDSYTFYDLFRQESHLNEAVRTPELTSRAVRVMGMLGTPAAQKRLVEVASDSSRNIEDRRAAAEAFKLAIQRRGLLLTRADVLHQYDLYNLSENFDQGTQQVLGMILDAMEAPLQKTADGQAGQ